LPDDLLVYQKQTLYTNESFNHENFFNIILSSGCKNVMISMADSKIADTIYNNIPFKKIDMREIIRTINPQKLFISREIAFINYEINDVYEEQ
jgi:DNA adenine methylase